MGTLTKKLHILKTGGTEETCNIYTTPEEVGGSPYLALEVDGQKGYVKLGSTTDANATHLRVKKNDTTYAALAQAIQTYTFIVTAGYHRQVITSGLYYDWIGFERRPPSSNFMGEVTPESIDSFKIVALYTVNDNSGYKIVNMMTSHKCILHVKGVDYKATVFSKEYNVWALDDESSKNIPSITNGEKIQVICTLL